MQYISLLACFTHEPSDVTHWIGVMCHTLHNPVCHVTREMYEACFSNDVSHIAQLCVTRHSRNHDERSTIPHNLGDTSPRKMHEAFFSSDVPHIAQSRGTRYSVLKWMNPFLEWRVTQDCAMCHTSLWRLVIYQCVTRHSQSVFVPFLSDVSHFVGQCAYTSFAPPFV